MNEIDKLVIRIKADTKQLQKELNQVNKKLGTTGTKSKQAGGAMGGMAMAGGALGASLKKLAGPAAILGVVVALGKMISFAARAGSEFEDLKDSLDTVYGSIEAGDEAFGKVIKFAQTTPFQLDTVTKAFISLKSVGIEPTARQMQVFADTASVAVDQKGAFEALIRVVQRAEAGALGLQELNMLADRGIDVFKGLKDELGLSRLELTEFGQTAGGAQIIVESLVNVLERQFGGAMLSKMDNMSTKVSNLGIAFKDLGNAIFESGLGSAIKAILDTTTSLINQLTTLLNKVRGEGIGIVLSTPQLTQEMTFEEMQAERARAAEQNISMITNQLQKMTGIAFELLTEEDIAKFKELGIEITDATSFWERMMSVQRGAFLDNMMTGGVGGVANAPKMLIHTLINAWSEFGVSTEDAEALVQNLIKALNDEEIALLNASLSKKEYDDATISNMLHSGKLVTSFGKIEAHLLKQIGDTNILAFAQENLGEIWEKNKDRLIELGIASEEALGDIITEMGEDTEDLAKTFDEALAPAIANLSIQFTNQFAQALLNGQDALESFKNFAKNIVSQIIAIFLQMAIVNHILNGIFGNVQGWQTLPTMGGKAGTSMPPVPPPQQTVPVPPPSNAGGGRVQMGRPVLVGERGAELFVPGAVGSIMNNMNTKNLVGSGSGGPPIVINQSVNFSTGIVPTVRAEVTKMLPQIASVTKQAVANETNRGGVYQRSIRGS